MKRRIPKTPATVLGDELRKTAIAYKADGQAERAEGYIDAANRVDAFLFAETKASLARGPAVATAPSSLEERLAALEENVGHLAALVASGQRKPEPPPPPIVRAIPAILRPPVKTRPSPLNGSRAAGRDPLSRCERRILTAAAQIGAPSEDVLLLMTGYRPSGSWIEAMASLRRSGFLDGTRITEEGIHAVGPVEKLPRGDALVGYWEQKLGRCAGAILRCVLGSTDPGTSIPEEQVLDVTNYRKSGSWIEAVSKLRKLRLLTARGEFRIPADTRHLLVDDA